MDLATAIFVGTIAAATPMLLAALGELVVEKSGVLNLGLEGMMLIGAAVAFWLAISGCGLPAAFVGGALAGMLASCLFALLALVFLDKQYATGLALAIFGTGLSAMIGMGFGSQPIATLKPLAIPVLGEIPVLGPLFFRFDIMVYLTLAMVPLIWWWLTRTKSCLILLTIGESP